MPGWLWLVAIAAALYALHLLASWAESKGWIYYRKSHGFADRAGNAMMEVQQILEPAKKNVIEMKQQKKAVRDDAGEPPTSEPPDAA